MDEPRLFYLFFFFLTFKEDFGSLEFFFYQIIYSMFGFVPMNLDLRAQLQIYCLDILGKSLLLFGKFHYFINLDKKFSKIVY